MSVFISANEAFNLNSRQFVDCIPRRPAGWTGSRHSLVDPEYGIHSYNESHLPNAIFANLDHDLSGTTTGINGRHPLPKLGEFHTWLQKNGLSPEKTIICYDNISGGIAARLWWMLTQLGYTNVFIMMESIDDWIARGYSIDITPPEVKSEKFNLSIDDWQDGVYKIKSLKDIEDVVPSTYLIDSRSPERHNGITEPYDEIAGTIPGSRNIFWQSHIIDKKLRDNIQEYLSEVINPQELEKYTVYCGSGVTATFNLAVFSELGLAKPAIFPGSYSMWSQNHPNNIEKKSK